MPELPEVETIRLGLQKYLIGHEIVDVEVKVPKQFLGNKKDVVGAKVVDIRRVGKGLIVDLDNDYSLAIHLKLTGQVIYRGAELPKDLNQSEKVGGELPNGWTRVIFKLKDPSFATSFAKASEVKKASAGKQNSKSEKGADAYLYFNDLRKFGWIKVIKTNEVGNLPFFKEMGPEPPVIKVSKRETNASPIRQAQGRKVSKGGTLTLEKFKEIIAKPSSPIKIILMDQKKIGGIGNIYSNEALFLAGINPKKPANKIREEEAKKLYESIIEVLKRGLKYGGSSDVNFVNALGENGAYQEHMLIYGRKGEKCFGCKGKVEKIMLGGRGTYFCRECQR